MSQTLNPNDAVATPQEQQLEQLIENYTGTPVENPEPPTTIVFECNKSLAVQDGFATKTNSWVNNFPSVKLRKGDMVSINSAFLSSRGSGDLLQFDETNNKVRLVFEYYCSNDNVNGKRIEYNILGNVENSDFNGFNTHESTDQSKPSPRMNCYPVNYRPMPLYRLMETFEITESANGGLDLLPFTDSTTNPPTSIKEPFWGYRNAGSQIQAIIEDDYVPGLFRDATLNISEPNFISWQQGDSAQSGYQKGSWDDTTDFDNLRIWYISTRNSFLSPATIYSSMRIHLGFAEGNADDDTATASLNFLRQLRPGMYVKFLNSGGLFNIDAFNSDSSSPSCGTKQYGTNCYYCDGYALANQGFTNEDGAMVDKFTQLGNHTNYEWINNPMGQIMRVSKVYYEIDENFPNGRAHIGGTGANWIKHIPYFEVQCAGSMSFAWGNPNAWTYPVPEPDSDAPSTYKGMPYSGGADINQPDITSGSLPSTRLTMSPIGAFQLRVLSCENNSAYQNITNWNGHANNNSTHANYFPTSNELDKTLYYGAIPYYKAGDNEYMSGTTGTGDGQFYQNQEQNLEQDLVNIDTFKTAFDTGSQSLTPINYNIQTLDTTGTPEYPNHMIYADMYFSENEYRGEELENFYAGGRLPVVYQADNELSTDYSNYISAKREHCFNFGSQGRRCWVNDNRPANNNRSDGTAGFYNTLGTNENLFGYRATDGTFDFIYNGSPAGRLSYASKNLNNISDKYCNTENGSVWFYMALNIDNITEQFDPTNMPAVFPLAGGDAMNEHNQATGMLNYIITCAGTPTATTDIGGTPPAQDIKPVEDGFMFYGYNTDSTAEPADGVNIMFSPAINGNKDAQGNPQNYLGSLVYNTPCACPDLRLVLSQFDSLCYAEFVDYQGNSEVMYINILWQPSYLGTNQDTANYFNNNSGNPVNWTSTNANHYGYEVSGVANSQNVLAYHFVPTFCIVKRDILGTGKVNFKGAWVDSGVNPSNLMPLPTDGGMFWRPNWQENQNFLTTRQVSKFRLFNSYSDMEWQVKFNDSRRDLYAAGLANFTASNQYSTSAGQTGNDSIYCGTDFILTEVPNMPFIKDTIPFTTSNTLWILSKHIQDGDPTIRNSGSLTWNIHYDYVDLELDPDATFFSPGDIANEITKQLHKPKDLYKSKGGGNKTGGTFPNTAGKYPANALFRPIHGPSGVDNQENTQLGIIDGQYHEGDFCFFVDMTKNFMKSVFYSQQYLGGANYNFAGDDGSKLVWDTNGRGRFQVFIKNNYTRINTAPTTNFFTMVGFTLQDPRYGGAGNRIRRLYGDDNFNYSFTDPNDPYQYYNGAETILSQWIGTATPTLNYNDLNSRFEWTYLHQPFYSLYDTGQGSASGGGSIVANIWTNAINGMDNWDRFGGVNVINWVAPIIGFGESSRRGTTAVNALTDIDPIGDAFMNKLGFDTSWRSTYSGSTTYADDNNTGYYPKGTTRSDYDVSQALVYNQLQNGLSITPESRAENAVDSDGGTSLGRVDYSNTDIFSFYDSARESGNWWGGGDNITYDKAKTAIAKITKVYNSIGYGWGSSAPFPPSIQNDTGNTQFVALNINDMKLPMYQVQVESSALTANELPSKTDIGYFLIKTDLIDKHEFYGSANDGTNIGALGILSKNYENNDFYFSFQSPVEFYLKHDRVITQIKTEITTPTHKAPIGLDFASSVIYTITRMNSAPESAEPPMSLKQALAYDIMDSQGLGNLMANPSGGYIPGANAVATGSSGGSRSGNNANAIQLMRNQLVNQLTRGVNPMATETALTQLQGQQIGRQRLPITNEDLGNLAQPDQAVIEELEDQGFDIEQAIREDILLKKRAERDFRTPSPQPDPPPAFEEGAPAETDRQRQARLRAVGRIRSQRETTPAREIDPTQYPPEAFLEQLLTRGVLGKREAQDLSTELFSGKIDPREPKTFSKKVLLNLNRFISLGEEAGIGLEASEDFKQKIEQAIADPETGVGRRRETQLPTFAMATAPQRLTPQQVYTTEADYNTNMKQLYPNDRLISLHDMVGQMTTHTGDKDIRTASDWINKQTAKNLGGGKWNKIASQKANPREANKPNENPYDIRTWRPGRLEQYRDFSKNQGALHLDKKSQKKQGNDRLNWQGYLQLHQESARRKVENKKKINLDKTTAEYVKPSEKPQNYTEYKQAHLASNLSGAPAPAPPQPQQIGLPAPAPE